MAVWDNLPGSGNVEDRRGMGAGLALGGGGFGLVGIVILIAMNLLGGTGNASLDQLIDGLARNSLQSSQSPIGSSQYQGQDNYQVFVSKVLGSTNATWKQQLAGSSTNYTDPKLVLFRSATQSGCGIATSSVGPHYCPSDQTIYLDETFFDELTNQLGAQGGDVAQAYVIAHESGHHLQNVLGTMERVQQASRTDQSGSNSASVGLELQADCYAGVWLGVISGQNVLQPGEINEAIDAAQAVGDDRIQEKVSGQISPETWTHGSSTQRAEWFTTGYNKKTITACTSI